MLDEGRSMQRPYDVDGSVDIDRVISAVSDAVAACRR